LFKKFEVIGTLYVFFWVDMLFCDFLLYLIIEIMIEFDEFIQILKKRIKKNIEKNLFLVD
jgi:hypothetical protein